MYKSDDIILVYKELITIMLIAVYPALSPLATTASRKAPQLLLNCTTLTFEKLRFFGFNWNKSK